MADNLVVNENTYKDVEAVSMVDENGKEILYYPDAVRYNEQTLTDEQKAQARENIGAITEKDAPVKSVNNKTGTVSLNASDVGARPDTWTPTAAEVGARPASWTPTASEVGAVPTTRKVNGQALSEDVNIDIPDSLSELTDDAAHRTVSDTEKGTWNAKSDFSGSYNDLTDKPSIPSIVGLASTDYVDQKVAAIVDSSPEALNTLNELAASLGNDPNFATTVSTAIGKKVDKTTTVNGHALSGNVTLDKSDVGLGNVPNVTTNDQTPTFAEASELANINTGEKISGLFGKIKKAITDLIAHIASKNNPHSVTKSQVGLGNVDNKSSATIRDEITSTNVMRALGYTPAAAALATQQRNGLLSSADKTKLDIVIKRYETGYRYTEISSGDDEGGNLYIGGTYDNVVFMDWDGSAVSMGDLIDTVRALCDELGVSEPFSSGYSLRRNRSVEQTDESSGENTDT